jgi:2-iminobutanoate/2-iminopropanoate deaminase
MHHKKSLKARTRPAPSVPIPRASKTDKLVFTSGHVAHRSGRQTVPENLQDRRAPRWPTSKPFWPRPAPGSADVIKTTVFLADIADFAAVNDVYKACFDKAGAHP